MTLANCYWRVTPCFWHNRMVGCCAANPDYEMKVEREVGLKNR
jgi:hypothetical protein